MSPIIKVGPTRCPTCKECLAYYGFGPNVRSSYECLNGFCRAFKKRIMVIDGDGDSNYGSESIKFVEQVAIIDQGEGVPNARSWVIGHFTEEEAAEFKRLARIGASL